ncbi:ABC transporter ATP-binding protein [Massilibacterium senegalense]|uniref:ABC transporter ATP-binding protein n=1 Tax=Massilibacterium senegalense TaxID=1632858 RepID=UPI0007826239|nr:ABC transporter ATP-binding protein [Massilibacterium senegalense]
MIEVKNVVKEYKIGRERIVKALDGISLTIEKGSFVSIMGPSGSGKSTLLALMGLLDVPTSGEMYFDGVETSPLKDKERTKIRFEKAGFIYQFSSLMPTLSAYENILLPVLLEKKATKEEEEWAMSLLKKVGLEEQKDHLPYQLSGGQQRRVALARSLINHPKILFADEPTGALDAKTAADMMAIFQDLHQQGTTIVMVTHDEKMAQYADTVISIIDGKIYTHIDE